MVDSKRATHFLVDHFAVIARNRTAERRKNALACVSLPPRRSSGLVRVLLSPCRGVVTRTIHKNAATKMKKNLQNIQTVKCVVKCIPFLY